MLRRTRSHYGEGSVYQDKVRGRWVARITDEAGERKYFYGKTKQDVEDQLKRARRLKEDGLPQPSTQPLGEYLSDWLNSETRWNAITPNSWVAYENHIRLHIIPAIGKVRLSELLPEHVDRLTTTLLKKALSPKSIKNIRGTLRAALEQARKRGHINRNVVELTEGPRVRRREKRVLAPADIRQLFQAVLTHRLAALYILDVATGLRKGELLGIRLRDLELDEQLLQVRVQLQRDRVTGKLSLRELKTEGGQRVIALPEGVVKLLQAHLANREAEKKTAGRSWRESGLLFTTELGAPLDGDNVLRTFQWLVRQAGLPHMTMHDLRHAHSNFMAMLNIHPKVAQRQLGHSNISTTMDIYTHVTDDGTRQVAAKFDQLLFRDTGGISLPVLSGLGLTDQMLNELLLEAELQGQTATEVVVLAIEDYLERMADLRKLRLSTGPPSTQQPAGRLLP